METTAALTKNHFKTVGVSTNKLTNLDSQITFLQNDYEDMKKTREQAKQAMQAKFDEVYNKIKQTKEFIISESNSINNIILNFQRKFENEIKDLENKKNDEHQKFATNTNNRMQFLEDNLATLDKNIENEKIDRINTEKSNIDEINNQLSIFQALTRNFELEKATRIENEKKTLDRIKNEGQNIHNSIENEFQERTKKVKDLEQHIKHELTSQDKFVIGFKKKTFEEFNYQINHVQSEMDNRFEQQNLVVTNLSDLITTIQGTLKIMGKNI